MTLTSQGPQAPIRPGCAGTQSKSYSLKGPSGCGNTLPASTIKAQIGRGWRCCNWRALLSQRTSSLREPRARQPALALRFWNTENGLLFVCLFLLLSCAFKTFLFSLFFFLFFFLFLPPLFSFFFLFYMLLLYLSLLLLFSFCKELQLQRALE